MTAALTKTACRAINSKIRTLRTQRRRVLDGRDLHWGVPWCHGPGSPGHQEPLCDGCGIVALCRDEAGEILEQIRQLEASLAPLVQGGLW